jgi:hypothetical protein
MSSSGPSIDVRLNRSDRCYAPGEVVSGAVVVTSQGSMKHSGIKLLVEGSVSLQLSARSIGLFEAFYSSLKPVQLLTYDIEVSPGGKCNDGNTEYPFEFTLNPIKDQKVYETYHGVYVNVQYNCTVDMKRGSMKANLKTQKEFVVQHRVDSAFKKEVSNKPFPFKVSPASLQNVKESSKKKIPTFLFDGYLEHTTCDIGHPFLGEIVIKECEVDIKSIELQLVRVESCTYMEGEAREATEIQNIQIADGNVVRGLGIPIHMIFPRLFTCSTTIAPQFKVEFEVNLIILFADNHMITENFPINLYRG